MFASSLQHGKNVLNLDIFQILGVEYSAIAFWW